MTAYNNLYNIRDYNEQDKNFIIATFLRGLYYGDSWFSQTDKKSFMLNYKKVIESFIANQETSTIKVACLAEDPNIILGYSILSSDFSTIHFVFVKKVWRQKGIARRLLPLYPTTVTHLTTLGKSLLIKFENVLFDPFKH